MQAQNHCALISGAGRGIGRAIAKKIAKNNYAVGLIARSQSELQACADDIQESGGRAVVLVCDVTVPEQVHKAVDNCRESFGPISHLINNAGCVQRVALGEMSLQDFDRIIACNLRSALICTQATLDDLRRQQGRIINIASISAKLGSPMLGAYSAAKAGLVAMTKALAKEEAVHGLQAFSVLPGSVDTRMLREGLPGAKADMNPEDVARLVAYLCDDAPKAMSGSAIEIFG